MPGELTVIDGSTFFLSDERGDVTGENTDGLFEGDVRHLSLWLLLVDGSPMHLLSSRTLDHMTARFFGTVAGAHVGHNPPISIERKRRAQRGVREELVLQNNSPSQQRVVVELRCGSDFLDIFEVKASAAGGARERRHGAVPRHGDRSVELGLEVDGFSRATVLHFSEPIAAVDQGVRFDVQLAPRGLWRLGIEARCSGDGIDVREEAAGRPFARSFEADVAGAKLDGAPRLHTDSEPLALSYRQSLLDLAALRFPAPGVAGEMVPAAGVPWFMALFGRDSLLTAYQALPFLPDLARATLKSLALLQATERDDFRDAEPGKILHEVRRGKLAFLGRTPHTPYFGSHDATPLFLILLDEYERWTSDRRLAHELRAAALAALAWIEDEGDRDGDGYLEYESRSRDGLRNQCWKDSGESIAFANGDLAPTPIATCEIQGYAYDARVRTARLAREVWGDEATAARLESDAASLKRRFARDFWCGDGHYALALDGEKRRVDAMTSNVGHLLWSGIVDGERAAELVARLMARDMFNGWGIRTMSTTDGAYNPIGYHVGTVWPHDTALIAEGLRRYGFRAEASGLAAALQEASAYFGHRLPEVFAGFDRRDTQMPVEYPTASRPQAWAAGAILLGLRTIMGLDPGERELDCRPFLPQGMSEVRLGRVPFRGGMVQAC